MKRVVSIVILGICSMLITFWAGMESAEATHYRGGNIFYENLGKLGGTTAQKNWVVIKATLTIYQRGSFHCALPVQTLPGGAAAVAPHTTSCCNGNGAPSGCQGRWRAVGGTFTWGSGGQPHPTLSGPQIAYQPAGQTSDSFVTNYMKVIDEDTRQDYLGFELVLYRIYPPTTAITTIAWGSCCWIGGTLPQLSNFEIKVTAQVQTGNQDPRFNSLLLLNACTNQQFRHNLNPSDPDRDGIEVVLTATVGGADKQNPPLTVSKSGIITWSKPAVGLWVIKVTAYDLNANGTHKGASTFRDFLLEVSSTCRNKPPTIVLVPEVITVKSGDKACTKVTVKDANTADLLTIRVSPRKSNVTITPLNSLSPNRPNPYSFTYCWTPQAADEGTTHSIQFTVSDSGRPVLSAQKEFKVTVKKGAFPTVTISPSGSTKVVSEGKCTTFKATAKDADSAIKSFSVTVPPFCARKRLSSTQFEIKCCPTFSDGGKTFDVVFTATDSDGRSKTTKETVKIRVGNTNRPPIIQDPGPQKAPEKRPFRLQIKASDPDGDSLTYTMTGLPAGAKIDPKTGAITWTPGPKDIGSYTVTVTVTDSQGAKTSVKIKLTVTDVNDPPTITSQPPTTGFVGQDVEYDAKATDPDTKDTLTWRLLNGPPGSSIDPKTGKLKWRPSKNDGGKQVEFEIEVCDNGNPQACAKQKWKMSVYLKCKVDEDCTNDDLCISLTPAVRVCVPPGCAKLSPKCRASRDFCKDSKCEENPCNSAKCASGTFCRPSDGKCVLPCAGVKCSKGSNCADGVCVVDPCATAGANGKACAFDETCDTSDAQNPKCVKNPCGTSSCRYGRVCSKDKCIDDPCAHITCPDFSKQRCLAGQCVDRKPCAVDIDCDGQDVCLGKKCFPPGCYNKTPQCSGSSRQCIAANCKPNDCASGAKNCNAGEFCRRVDNKCVKSCANVACNKSEKCVDGQCVKDACSGVQCQAGELCVGGRCENDNCNASNVCRHGRVCNRSFNTCTDDPCADVKCPNNTECRNGECLPPPDCKFDNKCAGDMLCVNRECFKPTCKSSTDCSNGKLCFDGKCLDDPCKGKTCGAGKVCKSGQCVDTCAGVYCETFEKCVEGKCTNNPCSGKRCPSGRTCVNGTCTNDLCLKETAPCKQGRLCKIDRCIDDPCANLTCPKGLTCKDGQCIGDRPCKTDSECPNGGVCVSNKCVAPNCYTKKCLGAKICLRANCGDDPCANKNCKKGEFCRPLDGTCHPVCPTCADGETCKQGACEPNPCKNNNCKQGERCEDGKCIQDLCAESGADTKYCRYRRVCKNSACQDDPCASVKCKAGETCRAGVCVGPPVTPRSESSFVEPPSTPDAGDHEGGIERQFSVTGGLGCLGCHVGSGPFQNGFLFFGMFLFLMPLITRKKRDSL